MTKHPTANTATKEYFTITSRGKFNTRIKLHDISGFLRERIIPNEHLSGWVLNSK